MPVSIVVPNLHSPLIGDVINALRAQTARAQIREIIVVGMDRHGLVEDGDLVRHIRTERPISAAAARNMGAAAASGDHLLFVDADCLLAPDALDRLLQALQIGYAAVVGGIVPEPEHYWTLCDNLMAFPEFLTLDRPGERGCLPSFCLLVLRSIWDQVGAFDERFPGAAGEDIDLSFRMRQAGHRLGCEPSAAVRHLPARANIGSVWHHHAAFGRSWRYIYYRYRSLMNSSQAMRASERQDALGAAALVPIACAFVLRLVARRRHMLRFWYAIPGMIWVRLAWYSGLRQAARQKAGAS
jgi:GT2 family glycosyltransferase